MRIDDISWSLCFNIIIQDVINNGMRRLTESLLSVEEDEDINKEVKGITTTEHQLVNLWIYDILCIYLWVCVCVSMCERALTHMPVRVSVGMSELVRSLPPMLSISPHHSLSLHVSSSMYPIRPVVEYNLSVWGCLLASRCIPNWLRVFYPVLHPTANVTITNLMECPYQHPVITMWRYSDLVPDPAALHDITQKTVNGEPNGTG